MILCEFAGFCIELEHPDVVFWHRGKSAAHRGRCPGKLLHGEAGLHEDPFTPDEAVQELDGVLREFLLLAATEDGRVRVVTQGAEELRLQPTDRMGGREQVVTHFRRIDDRSLDTG